MSGIGEFTREDVARCAAAAANRSAAAALFGFGGEAVAMNVIDAIACGAFLNADRVLDGEVLFNWAKLAKLHDIRSFDDLNDDEQFAFEVFARVYLALLPMAERSEKQVQDAVRAAAAARQADQPNLLGRAIERLRARKAARRGPLPDAETKEREEKFFQKFDDDIITALTEAAPAPTITAQSFFGAPPIGPSDLSHILPPPEPKTGQRRGAGGKFLKRVK